MVPAEGREAILSLEDDPVALYYPGWLPGLLRERAQPGVPLGQWLGKFLTWLPQHADERKHARMRRSLVEVEDYLRDLLAFSGTRE